MAGESLGVGRDQPLKFDEAIEAVEAAGGSNPYRLVVAGGRDFSDADRLDQAINQALNDYGPEQLLSAMNEERPYGNLEVVSGMATGADTLGRQWALDRGLKVHEYPAQWDALDAPSAVVRTRRDGRQYNAKAGYDRNALMAQNADAVLVMPGGSGTEHMVKTALAQGLPVYDARTGSVQLLSVTPGTTRTKPFGRKAGQRLQERPRPEPPKPKQLNVFEEMPEWAGDAAKWGAAAAGTGLAAYAIADLNQPG